MDALREELHLFAARKGSMVGPDHHHRHRRHHRPAPDGLGRLGGALDRRGERHHLPQARGQVRPAHREGRGVDALQRGQVLEAQQLHHRPGRRPAAARRAPARAAAAQRAEAARLRAGRQRPLGLLHLQRHEAGLDQPGLRVDAHGGAGRALRRPVVVRQGEVPAPEQRRHQDGRRRQQPRQADARLSLVQARAVAARDPGDGAGAARSSSWRRSPGAASASSPRSTCRRS